MPWLSGVKTEDLSQLVAQRLAYVRRRLASAAAPDQNITIVAVTKGGTIEHLKAALANGLCDLGENYASDLKTKSEAASQLNLGPIRWHFQGKLQSNKVKRLSKVVSVWQTLDSLKAAEKLARYSPGASVFIEILMNQDPNRPGVPPAEVADFAVSCRKFELDVRGLMCVARPGSQNLAEADFKLCNQLRDIAGLDELSMGMSSDFELAVQYGATTIRLGRILFDPNYSI